MKLWRILFFAPLVGTPSLYPAYLGLQFSGHFLKPTFYWTNVFARWIVEQRAILEAQEGSYTMVKAQTPEEQYEMNQFEAVPPEISSATTLRKGIGGSFWLGAEHVTTERFYVGIEGRITYKHLDIQEDQKMNLVDTKEGVYGRHYLNMKVDCEAKIEGQKNFEGNISLRGGFYPIKALLIYAKVGISLNNYTQEKFSVTQNGSSETLARAEDSESGDAQRTIFLMPPPAKSVYTSSTGHYFYGSLNVGAGFEYSFTKKWFMRVEYEYAFAFATQLHLQTEIGGSCDITPIQKQERQDWKVSSLATNSDFYKPYSIRYQDREQSVALGIGIRFSS
ncbi:hypothetical protein AGMMS49949_03640 [Alphaproteobacteria bacterium]|nr:hypothetical protein AGMMS49949_03640 [Alphaproteobacteria bacterium]GHS96407.1 hypothetical protein AGMMS50296_2510 [Alphaproteobacteria bacterium]